MVLLVFSLLVNLPSLRSYSFLVFVSLVIGGQVHTSTFLLSITKRQLIFSWFFVDAGGITTPISKLSVLFLLSVFFSLIVGRCEGDEEVEDCASKGNGGDGEQADGVAATNITKNTCKKGSLE